MQAELARRRVWDLPTRLLHWLLVALFAFSWWSAENHAMDWHRWSGYGVLGLLLFRLYWGLVGSTTARFASFVRGPRAFFAYARRLLQRPGPITPGHNPMGGWSVLALLALLLVQVGTGLFATDTDGLESGPLASKISYSLSRDFAEVHEISFNLLLALVGLHVAVVLFYWVYKRENLIAAMLSGDKRLPAAPELARLRFEGWRRALPGVLIAAAIVWAIVRS
ncbi:MAG: cytochrome b/b6 domain-containing protein [Pseudomonadota bacterium]